MHLRDGKRLTGRGMIILVHIQVSACEALTLQILSLNAQKEISAEIMKLSLRRKRGTASPSHLRVE